MERWGSVDEVLDFAIRQEQEAAEFYLELAETMGSSPMRGVFKEFAREEEGHKAKLLNVKTSGTFGPSSDKIADLKIGDYLAEVDPGQELDYQHALILAMKREKAAFKLYTDLAQATDDPGVKSVMLALAQEEAKHKLRFEIEYDEKILAEN